MSDYNFLMESRLSPEQFSVLTMMSRLAAEHGQRLYLVGGAVRDLTYGQQIVRDLDFIVEGSPQKILRSLPTDLPSKAARSPFEPAIDQPLAVDRQEFDDHLGSAELMFSNGVRAELAMSREEVYSRPGHRPEVKPAAVFDDLKRRDFAINAMAVSLHPNSRGLLLDPTNGAGDIERREIRALQSRCFFDDPSRIYRLLRLAIRLDFTIDERTQRWLDHALEEEMWTKLDSNQQARELAAILREDHPDRVLKTLAERKLLAGLDKKLASTHFAFERFARIRNILQSSPGADPFLLNFEAFAAKMGGAHKDRFAKRLIHDPKTMKLAMSLDKDAKKLDHTLTGNKASVPSQVYAILSPQPKPLVYYVLTTTKSAKVQNRIKSFLFKFPEIRAKLPRAELQSLGIKAGPKFDQVLADIFAMQLDGKIKSHPQLMKEIRQLAGIKEPPPPPPPAPTPLKRGRKAEKLGVPPQPQPEVKKGEKPSAPAHAKPVAPAAVKSVVPAAPPAKKASPAPVKKAAPPAAKKAVQPPPKKAAPAGNVRKKEKSKSHASHKPAKKKK